MASRYSRKGCFKCGELNHIAENCPHETRLCYNCKEAGHESNACPNPRSTESKECYNCHGVGHIQAECPSLRTGMMPPDERCYNCGMLGHKARFCRNPRREGAYAPQPRFQAPVYPAYGQPRPGDAVRCYKCGELNHMARSCTAIAPGFYAAPARPLERPKECYICHQTGHTTSPATLFNLLTVSKTTYRPALETLYSRHFKVNDACFWLRYKQHARYVHDIDISNKCPSIKTGIFWDFKNISRLTYREDFNSFDAADDLALAESIKHLAHLRHLVVTCDVASDVSLFSAYQTRLWKPYHGRADHFLLGLLGSTAEEVSNCLSFLTEVSAAAAHSERCRRMLSPQSANVLLARLHAFSVLKSPVSLETLAVFLRDAGASLNHLTLDCHVEGPFRPVAAEDTAPQYTKGELLLRAVSVFCPSLTSLELAFVDSHIQITHKININNSNFFGIRRPFYNKVENTHQSYSIYGGQTLAPPSLHHRERSEGASDDSDMLSETDERAQSNTTARTPSALSPPFTAHDFSYPSSVFVEFPLATNLTHLALNSLYDIEPCAFAIFANAEGQQLRSLSITSCPFITAAHLSFFAHIQRLEVKNCASIDGIPVFIDGVDCAHESCTVRYPSVASYAACRSTAVPTYGKQYFRKRCCAEQLHGSRTADRGRLPPLHGPGCMSLQEVSLLSGHGLSFMNLWALMVLSRVGDVSEAGPNRRKRQRTDRATSDRPTHRGITKLIVDFANMSLSNNAVFLDDTPYPTMANLIYALPPELCPPPHLAPYTTTNVLAGTLPSRALLQAFAAGSPTLLSVSFFGCSPRDFSVCLRDPGPSRGFVAGLRRMLDAVYAHHSERTYNFASLMSHVRDALQRWANHPVVAAARRDPTALPLLLEPGSASAEFPRPWPAPVSSRPLYSALDVLDEALSDSRAPSISYGGMTQRLTDEEVAWMKNVLGVSKVHI